VVLRLAYEGGFVPLEWTFASVPAFTLYGDGTVVVPGAQAAIYPGPALPAVFSRQVDEDGVQALLERALDAGLGREDLVLGDTGDVAIADASTAVFTLTVDGRTTTASAYALGLEEDEAFPGLPEDQARTRRALARLAADLGDLRWLHDGSVAGEEPWDGEAARLLVRPYRGDPELPQPLVAWPLDVRLADAGEPVGWDPEARCVVVDGDAWRRLLAEARDATALTPWRDGGRRWSIAIRPLLPDEPGC
jgi:hypothetical protein